MIIITTKVVFLKCQISMFFLFCNVRKVKLDLMVNEQTARVCRKTHIYLPKVSFCCFKYPWSPFLKIVSKYEQEIPESQTVDQPMVSRGRVTQQSRYTRKTD